MIVQPVGQKIHIFSFADVETAAPEAMSKTVLGYVSSTEGDIEIASKTKTPNIYVDTANDYAGVARAVNDLISDIKSVTGIESNITADAANADM